MPRESSAQRWEAMKIVVRKHVNWSWLKRILTLVFFAVVAFVLYQKGSQIEWAKVLELLRKTPINTLATGIVLSFLCYIAYGCFDLFGRYFFKVKLNVFKTVLIGCISFASNLNLGAIIGSVAFRYRLYSRVGVDNADVTRILSVSVATNWLGYVLLAGGLFLSGAIDPPDNWAIGKQLLQGLGAIFVLLICFYLYLCAFSSKREITLRARTFTLPSLKMALLQFAVSCTHWSLMAAVIYQFFAGEVSFATVYAVLLVSGIAAAVSHIPGGLGVLEAVFLALLSGQVEDSQILASVFAYRCVFYLAPLSVALPVYLGFETYFGAQKNRQKESTP